jgi:Zn-dependent protease with chaperone function
MAAALLVFVWSAAVAWKVPAVLTRLTRGGGSARLGIAVWLIAMVSVLASGGIALAFLIRTAVTGWSHVARVICRSVAGGACTPVIYRSALFEIGIGVAAVLASAAVGVLAWRYGRRLQIAQRQTRAHAEIARLTGRRLSGSGTAGPGTAGPGTARPDAVVLDVPQLAAYCVPPGIIVVTSGALSILAPAQLTAVLAHERAHLAGRHHLLLALTRGLAAVFPGVPVFARGQGEVARLAEMRADDAAAERAGRRPLIEALLAMGTGTAVTPMMAYPATALAAAGYAVAARVERLLDPPRRASQVRCALALGSVLVLLPLLSVLVALAVSGW